MAAIIEGQQYALTSQFTNGKGQSMVFVKLTDSALKAIEDYAASVTKGNSSPNFKPTIEFRPNNSQGVITIPTKVSNNESEKHSYKFSVKDIQNDGILDCIEQNKMSMESLGKIMLRMQIHANDDSYQNTKAKMAVAAEQELKKYNTKVIQSSDPNVGRKVKVKRPFNSKPFVASSNNAQSNASSMYKQSNSMPLTSMPRFSKFSNANTLSKQPNFHSNGTFSAKTIRENLIHLLAVKPMKIQDLLSKLQEKFKESFDKNNLVFTNVLNNVSTVKDEMYYLKDSLSEEVQIDWQHYSKEERDLVQKRISVVPLANSIENAAPNVKVNANMTSIANSNGSSISPLSDASARSHSSPNSVGASPNLKHSPYNKGNSNIKRNNDSLYSGNNLKRFKGDSSRPLAYSNGKSYPSANSSAILSHSSPLDKLSNTVSDHESPESRNILTSNSNCYKSTSISLLQDNYNQINKKGDSSDRDVSNSRVSSYQRISGNGSGSINSSPDSSPDSGISHIGNAISSDSSINNDSDDYLSKYTKIQSNEQLTQYRSDFSAEYPEYQRLFDYIESVSRQFEEFRELILSKEEDSEEWHDLIKQTIEKYNEVKHKSRYNSSHKRLTHLHYKLLHIKNLISDFTRNHEKAIPLSSRFSSSQLKS